MRETFKPTALAVSLLLGSAMPVAANSLNGDQIRAFFIGTPFEVRRLGMRAQLVYAQDGTFIMDG
ncbi:hypothetical protein [uncultured Tateyamaria sp.]|uniref:hypothetical protein n=1 Tax=uncultured Tateyamaria sp. TaxID=455651 RepID=UPI002625C835|nr:hypothetical protein [uncultured Tateyamaria sp.]